MTLAFRAGLFNIGAQGQLIMGAICAGYVGFTWDLPPVPAPAGRTGRRARGRCHLGWHRGFLKARTGAHEVITTIMFNYLAASVLIYALGHEAFQRPGSDNALSPRVDDSATFPTPFGDSFDVHLGVILAILAGVGVWWLLERSTWGFELRAVGANADASRTAGMSVSKIYTLAMLLAGALAGLAATMQVLGNQNSLSPTLPGSIGFDAITVALLGRASPLGTVLAGLLFGAMSVGGVAMQASAGTPKELTDVLQALIVLFVAAPALVKGILHIKEPGGGVDRHGEGLGLLMATATAISDEGVVDVRDRADIRRQIKLSVIFGLVSLALVFFYLRIDDFTVTYTLGERVTLDDPAKSINAQPIMIAGIVVARGVPAARRCSTRCPRAPWGRWSTSCSVSPSSPASLIWCYADQTGTFSVAIINPFPGTIRLATPLIFGALAGCLCERSGVINIAIEGQFLIGAFFAAVASSLFFSAEMGLVGGIIAGVAHGRAAGRLRAALPGQPGRARRGADRAGDRAHRLPAQPDPRRPGHQEVLNDRFLEKIPISGLVDIPVIGPALFNQRCSSTSCTARSSS